MIDRTDTYAAYMSLARFERATAIAALTRAAVTAIAAGVARGGTARARRRAIRTLSALDDHILDDIGVPRGRIPDAVDGLLAAEPVPARRAPARRRIRRVDGCCPTAGCAA